MPQTGTIDPGKGENERNASWGKNAPIFYHFSPHKKCMKKAALKKQLSLLHGTAP
jgi:hypothetical protein